MSTLTPATSFPHTPATAGLSHNCEIARRYAQVGFRVFPCSAEREDHKTTDRLRYGKARKHPLVAWTKVATADERGIIDLWSKYPDALVGLPCKANGLLVIDCDRHSAEQDGVACFAELCEGRDEPLPPHPVVATDYGGEHHVFRMPDAPIGNMSIADGVETRGFRENNEGGYIIAAGSCMPDGNGGWWVVEGAPALTDGPLPLPPKWLIDLCRTEAAPALFGERAGSVDNREEAWALEALNRVARDLAAMPPNTGRDNKLISAACTMGRMIANGWIGAATVEGRLFDACVQNSLMKEAGAERIRDKISRGIKKGRENPHPPLSQALPKANGKAFDRVGVETFWPEPKPLPSGLAKVEPFSLEFLPDRIAPWVDDIANRLQCPVDYVAVAALTALGSVIGRRAGIRPQEKTDWIEVPNIWGMFIGRPGQLKSPAMNAALGPLHRLETEASKENEIARQAYAVGLDAYKLRKKVLTSLEAEALRKGAGGDKIDVAFDLGDEPKEPLPIRFKTNDCTYEAIGEMLVANPSGILIERDEIVSLLIHLDGHEQARARGFYLQAWSGLHPYTFDRVIRGHLALDGVCISILGNTQPSRIAAYVRRANADGGGGDGLLQRFGLMVWPDVPAEWHNVDEYPDSRARETVLQIFGDLSRLTESEALKRGALMGAYDKIPAFRMDEAARGEFLDYREGLEGRLRSGELSPALEGHLAKYRKLVPALSLINHLTDGGSGDVPQGAVLKALAFAEYLESHARRVYGAANTVELDAGRAILARIRKGDLDDEFTARDVHRHSWSKLTDRDHIQAGLDLLVDLDYLAVATAPVGVHGGRPKTTYKINPKVRQ